MPATLRIEERVPLGPLTTMGVGGPARFFTRATSADQLSNALRFARARDLPVFVLGGGSNLVVADRGIEAVVVRVEIDGFEIERTSEGAATARIGAGVLWDAVVERAVAEGLAGIECLSGIPGSTGATPIQNVGAYGQEVGDVLQRVVVVDRATLERVEMDRAACELGYRDSVFKRALRDRFVVVEVELELRAGGVASPLRYGELSRALGEGAHPVGLVRRAVIDLRRAKAMVLDASAGPDSKSAGSFFMNPIVPIAVADRVEEEARARGALSAEAKMPRFDAGPGEVKLAAGWLIERAGLAKGSRRGNVGLSTRHALAVVNLGAARAAEIVAFAREVRDKVEAVYAVRLHAEPELVGFEAEERGGL